MHAHDPASYSWLVQHPVVAVACAHLNQTSAGFLQGHSHLYETS